MKYLYSWIKEYYSDAPQLSDLEPILVQLGHDVEAISHVSREGLIVVEIKSIEKHPNAERLNCVTVDNGTNESRIVCGAPDLKIGQKVILAEPGTVLPSGLTIQASTIRGELSHGMLCAADEIGLNESHEGLYVLPETAQVGSPAQTYLPEDAVLTLDITSDRGDVLSHFGLARDLKSFQDKSILTYNFLTPPTSNTPTTIEIDTVHPDCRGISFAIAERENTKINTPLLWQSRLNLVGQKSINFPTDLTNYLMLAFGQPLHAYDQSKLESSHFGVRRAHEGERFTALTQTELRLTQQNLVITANDKPVALAGVIGGLDTKTETNSTAIVFEAASFIPKSISLSSRGLNLLTDAALRFERDRDEELRLDILNHCLALWCNITNGSVSTIVSSQVHKKEIKPVRFNPEELISFIGSSFSHTTLQTLLESVGCKITSLNDSEWDVTPPSWRHDILIFEDIAEEIIRLVNINSLVKAPLSPSVPQWKRSHYWKIEYLKDTFVALGLTEIQTYPFVSQAENEILNYDSQISLELVRPPMKDKNYLRTALEPSILGAIASNPETPNLGLFEIAHTYHQDSEQDSETEHIGICIASTSQTQVDIWWQNIFERLHLPVSSWMSRVKTIRPEVLDFYKIRKPIVTLLEMPLEKFEYTKSFDIQPVIIPDLDTIEVKQLSSFQTSRRDISMLVPLQQPYDAYKLANDILQWGKSENIVNVFCADEPWIGPSIPENTKSISIQITYQATDHTLTQEEINSSHSKLESYLKDTYDATIR